MAENEEFGPGASATIDFQIKLNAFQDAMTEHIRRCHYTSFDERAEDRERRIKEYMDHTNWYATGYGEIDGKRD